MEFKDLQDRPEPLFLNSITDLGNQCLRALVCVGGHTRVQRNLIGLHVNEISKLPIEYTEAPYYEITWSRYFSFWVRPESYAGGSKNDEFVGRGFRRFQKSWLMDNVPAFSNGTQKLKGPLSHFGLYGWDSIVDVLAFEEPIVRDLGRRRMKAELPRDPLSGPPLPPP